MPFILDIELKTSAVQFHVLHLVFRAIDPTRKLTGKRLVPREAVAMITRARAAGLFCNRPTLMRSLIGLSGLRVVEAELHHEAQDQLTSGCQITGLE
jgi:hypothetical protein